MIGAFLLIFNLDIFSYYQPLIILVYDLLFETSVDISEVSEVFLGTVFFSRVTLQSNMHAYLNLQLLPNISIDFDVYLSVDRM